MRTLLFVTLLAACSKSNPYYCPGNPDDNCLVDADVNAPQGCTTSEQCTNPAKPLCDTSAKVCVACTADDIGACGGTTPICGNDNTCGPCTAHSQCTASDVCLPIGACADEGAVAYVSPTGTDNATCSRTMPCTNVTKALATGLPYIKLIGTTDEGATITVDGKSVTFLANPGAKLTRSSNGVLLEIRGSSKVEIYDLEISGATGAAGVGVGISMPPGNSASLSLTRTKIDSNQGGGISVSGGTLTVSQSSLSSNQGGGISISGGTLMVTQSTLSSNQGGGISVSGVNTMFEITNNFIVYNGTAIGANATQTGGVALSSNTSGAKFEWNTVAFNQSDGSLHRAGVSCTGAMVAAAGNLIYRNSEPDGTGGLKTDASTQRNATGCQFGNSLALANDDANLGFKSPATAPFDFHLTASSPNTVVDAGGVCSGFDVDHDDRPVGSGCDLGADEHKR